MAVTRRQVMKWGAGIGARAGEKLSATSLCRIATIDWVADNPIDYGLGNVVNSTSGPGLRGATIEYLRKNGFNA